jgi:2-oxoisovalerate dehydrogenase E1 component
MPKSIVVDPREARKTGALSFTDIPLNAYVPDAKKEVKRHGKFVFGSHRSHGEIIAKCLSAAARLTEGQVSSIMKDFFGGALLRVVEKGATGPAAELALDFILYGTCWPRSFARKSGFNRGLGGSMHAFFTPFGSHAEQRDRRRLGGHRRRVGLCTSASTARAASSCPISATPRWAAAPSGRPCASPRWTSTARSGTKDVGGAPPILFSFFNNFYGMGGQTDGETMGFKILARVGAGVNPENMHAERVDGYNPLAVADAVERKKKILLEGRGPVLMDTITYRYSGHSPSDASSYRTKEEVALWQDVDCIKSYGDMLVANKLATPEELAGIQKKAVERMTRITALAVSLEVSPRIAIAPDAIGEMMFSNGNVEKFDTRQPEMLLPVAENPRILSNARKSRTGVGPDGKPLPKSQVIALRDAIFEAMLHRFSIDPTMIAFGEENRDWGGAFAVYRGLTEALPYHRLFNSPISEGAIVGAAVGYALSGGRAVPELMYCDFLGRAGDEVFNQMCKWQAMSAGVLKMPLVLRVSVGSKYGAQHSQDWSSVVAHMPGLKAMFPVTPYDAKGMLNLALRGTDPVIFFESQRVYDIGELFAPGGVPEGYFEVPEGEPAIRREGTDITLITVGATLYKALAAADILNEKYGVSAEVIDARFINPLRYEALVASVRKTGRCVLASDACERGSFLHTMASNISQMAFDSLDAPVAVVGARNWITPCAEMEEDFFPQPEWILDTIHERVLPLPGHTPTTNQGIEEMQRRNARGV